MRTLFTTLGLLNLALSVAFLAPACMLTGTVLLTAGALGGRDADYADEA
jgi:hypothetical protein